ncbi:MAG TPA: group 1 truncated hemoglobin [Polyangiaceae bacterium]|nr:group 1 truncated hemoglobin [Polyangiaceae bacterium]
MSEPSLYDELGGEAALRRIVDRFVDRMFDDMMIGYLFRAARRERVKDKEFEHAAEHLGAGIAYTGKPLDAAHRPHAIRGGQFMRRVRILETTLDELGVPERVKAHWIAHTLELRPLVTDDEGDVCAH